MSGYSSQAVRFGRQLFRTPSFLGEGTTPDPNFHMVDILIVEFAPQTDLSSQDVLLVGIIFNHLSDIDVEKIQPGLIVAVGHTQVVSHSHIQVIRAVLRHYHLVLSSWHSTSPPMYNVSLLDLDVPAIHPIHKFFVGVQVSKNLVLLASVVTLDLVVSNAFFSQELGFVGETGQNHLVSSQVNDRVWENVKDLGKNFFNKFVSFVQGDIERSHEPRSEGTSNSFVFWSQAPTSSMARSIQFRHNSHSSPHRISHQFSGILSRIGLVRRIGGILSNFRMRVKDEGERILIDDMPMEDIQFVVHHCIHRFLKNLHRYKMSGGVHHQTSVGQERLILDRKRQVHNLAVVVLVPGTPDRLHKSLEPSHKTHKGH